MNSHQKVALENLRNGRGCNTVLYSSSCDSELISHKASRLPASKTNMCLCIMRVPLCDLPFFAFFKGDILSLSLFSLAMFSLKRSGSPIQKVPGSLPVALPSRSLASTGTKSPSNRGKMKKTSHWETVRRPGEGEQTHEGEEEGVK